MSEPKAFILRVKKPAIPWYDHQAEEWKKTPYEFEPMSQKQVDWLREIVEHAKTKTPCASNYQCLLADLTGLLAELKGEKP